MSQIQLLEEQKAALYAQLSAHTHHTLLEASSQGTQRPASAEPFASSQGLVRHLDASYARLPSRYEAMSPTKRRAATAHRWLVGKADDPSGE